MTKKINWILILQAWAMAWVIIGHAFLYPVDEECNRNPMYVQVLFNIAYSFHMPLFIMVSGYLFYMTRIERKMPYWKMFLDKLKRLGIPFIFFTLIAMILKSLFSVDMARPTTISFHEIFNSLLYPSQGPMHEMWFIAVIMWMFILRPIWEWSLISNLRIIATVLFLTAIHLCWSIDIELFCISRAIRMAIFFYIGIFVRYLFKNQKFNYGGGICHVP